MKVWGLLLLLFSGAVYAQAPPLIDCIQNTATPCSPNVQVGNTVSGDPAWKGFGKANAWFQYLASQETYAGITATLTQGSGGVAGTYLDAFGNFTTPAGSGGNNSTVFNCELVATSNVTSLVGLPFVDNRNGTANGTNCILLAHQNNGVQNGPWLITLGSWPRPPGYSSGSTTQAIFGMTIGISDGAQYIGSTWTLATPNVTVDTTPTTWIRLPPPALAPGSTTARTIDARAGDVANVLDYGAYGDTIRHNYGNAVGSNGINCTAGSASVTLDLLTIPSAYNAANILIPGCGNPGAVIAANPGSGAISFNFATPGTGYVPQSVLTCSGGTSTIACQMMVYSTTVVSATVASPGSGCSNGTQTVTGTTDVAGSNATTWFTASVTVSGNAIAFVNSVTTGGTYYVNPTLITAEPVTGAGCVGAQLSVVMGALTGAVTVAGNYTVVPTNPVGFTSSPGTGAQVNFGSGPYWYGNPLVGTITSTPINAGGNTTFTVSANAGTTLVNGVGTVYLWLNDDEPGVLAAKNSGKQTILFPNPALVAGWESGYTFSTGLSISGSHRWDIDCQGNFISGASAINQAGAIITINDASAFRASSGSILQNCEFDAAGNFARDLTVADWDWMVVNNTFKNATQVNIGWSYGGHSRESYLTNFYIFNDGYNPLTLPNNGLDSEADDTRISMGTIVGVTGCALNSGSFGDVHYTDIHSYYINASDTYCENGAGDFWTNVLADTPAPEFAGYRITNGYNFFITDQYQTGGWQGQSGIVFTNASAHNQVIGGTFTNGNNTPPAFACIDQSTANSNTFDPAPYGCEALSRHNYGIYNAATKPIPACTSTTKYTWAIVTDATSPTYNGIYSGGSNVTVEVLCNGNNWVTH